jgi:hypothetical protein
VLPAGRRQRDLERRLRAAFSPLFQACILLIDAAAAGAYADIARDSRRAGRAVPHDDALIAAIVRAHGFTLATRNGSHFAGAGIEIIDPWTAAP